MIFLGKCDNCGGWEERMWRDSWSGMEICNGCMYAIVGDLTNSPHSDGDNIIALLEQRVGND